AVFAFVTLSIVIKACLYTTLASTLGTSHNHRKYRVKPSYNPFCNTLEKVCNCDLTEQRIFIEHIVAWIKCFKILKYPYRNKRKDMVCVYL
ncbi:MAG: hypothetical protein LBC12_02700, partial [Nitrososphaerota archaeon]|nr:hypothetical protein [Nitrososphaerota archaeon]